MSPGHFDVSAHYLLLLRNMQSDLMGLLRLCAAYACPKLIKKVLDEYSLVIFRAFFLFENHGYYFDCVYMLYIMNDGIGYFYTSTLMHVDNTGSSATEYMLHIFYNDYTYLAALFHLSGMDY